MSGRAGRGCAEITTAKQAPKPAFPRRMAWLHVRPRTCPSGAPGQPPPSAHVDVCCTYVPGTPVSHAFLHVAWMRVCAECLQCRPVGWAQKRGDGLDKQAHVLAVRHASMCAGVRHPVSWMQGPEWWPHETACRLGALLASTSAVIFLETMRHVQTA